MAAVVQFAARCLAVLAFYLACNLAAGALTGGLS